MTFSIRAIIRALAAPKHRLSCPDKLWRQGLAEVARRGKGRHESGAFLLGRRHGSRGRVEQFAYYDDFDPSCLDSGIVIFDGAGFGPLWELCRQTGLTVLADLHTHPSPGPTRQSTLDKDNPMIAQPGHVALIVPNFAHNFKMEDIGVYEYLGSHNWCDHSGARSGGFFYTGIWA
ncbi:MAG: hypothetical protein OXK78_09465 [Caldilineaceae bacterium]|nr:hypothetical protein [Caldilineaceae bacterium]